MAAPFPLSTSISDASLCRAVGNMMDAGCESLLTPFRRGCIFVYHLILSRIKKPKKTKVILFSVLLMLNCLFLVFFSLFWLCEVKYTHISPLQLIWCHLWQTVNIVPQRHYWLVPVHYGTTVLRLLNIVFSVFLFWGAGIVLVANRNKPQSEPGSASLWLMENFMKCSQCNLQWRFVDVQD